jgi:hypothetical protein
MAGILAARNNAQSCSSINQIPVICQFFSQENQSVIGGKVHGCGSGMCGNGHQTEGGLGANYFSDQAQGEVHL